LEESIEEGCLGFVYSSEQEEEEEEWEVTETIVTSEGSEIKDVIADQVKRRIFANETMSYLVKRNNAIYMVPKRRMIANQNEIRPKHR